MKDKLLQLIQKHDSVAKFFIVGVSASATHGTISWVFYYHIWEGFTILSTLMGYTGGWVVSYLGNRLWSFRPQLKGTSVTTTAARFIISQLATMCILLSSTWLTQQLIILYFWWYIITNNLTFSSELERFSEGASYPPALLTGMILSAVCSYIIMRKFVFKP